MTKYDSELHRWEVVKHPRDKWNVITGVIMGDQKKRFRDGTLVTTSKLKKIEDGYAHTTYSVYKLIGPGRKPEPETAD